MSKKRWVTKRELRAVRDLLRERFQGHEGETAIVRFDEVTPLLLKSDPNRIVWTRTFRREFQDLGVRCSIRNGPRVYRFQIVDLEKWQRSFEGEPVPQPMPRISAPSIPHPPMIHHDGSDPLIPEGDPDYHLPEFTPDLIQAIQDNERVLLVGPTGCGKSSLVREIASRKQRRFIRVNLNGETGVPDLLGQFKIRDREMVFQEGPVPRAMRAGAWLCLDELDAAIPQVLFCLQALLEEGGQLFIPETGEWIESDSEFRVVFTANTLGRGDESGLYAGTNILNEAFLDRIHSIFLVDYLPPDEEFRLVRSKVPGLPASEIEQMIRVAGDIRKACVEGVLFTTFSTRKILAWSRKTLQLGSSKRAALYVLLNRLGEDDRRVVEEVLQRHGF